jgi:predicted metal-dependent hydrolase
VGALRVSLERGIELFNRGLYWEAHEAWEEAWTPDRHGPDRGFYKGLIQVAAGCLHYGRRNRRGTVNKWRSGIDYLRPYLPRHRGVELQALVGLVDANLRALEESPDGWPEGLPMPPLVGARRASPSPYPDG